MGTTTDGKKGNVPTKYRKGCHYTQKTVRYNTLWENLMTFIKFYNRSSTPTGQCQKCLQYGHWTYQCKGEPVYAVRPSRSVILKNIASMSARMPNQERPPDPYDEYNLNLYNLYLFLRFRILDIRQDWKN
jgi:hypothetical protein